MRPKSVRTGLDVNSPGTRLREGLMVRTPQLSLWLWGVGEGPPCVLPEPVRGVGRRRAQAQTLAASHPGSMSGRGAAQSWLCGTPLPRARV